MAKKAKLHNNYRHQGGFIGLPRRIFISTQYKNLSLTARCLLDELQNIYRPDRNGRLVFSVEMAAERLQKSYVPVSNAFKELEKAKFIERSLEADYSIGRAREWRLTYEPCNNREPTDDWKDCEPEIEN